MEYSHETRRYVAKVSVVGIIAATLFALVCGALHLYTLNTMIPVYGKLQNLWVGYHNLLTEAVVAAAGLVALAVCGMAWLVCKRAPARGHKWMIGTGKVFLLAAPAGYIQSLCGLSHSALGTTGISKSFLLVFALLAVIFVGFSLGRKGISLHPGLLTVPKKTYARRLLLNTALVFGILAASFVLLVLRNYRMYGNAFWNMSVATKITSLVLEPLRVSLPVILIPTLLCPLLSLVARWNATLQKRLTGKGTTAFLWLSFGVACLSSAVSILYRIRLIQTSAMSVPEEFGEWESRLSFLTSVLSLWALGLLLSRVRESKPAMWGIGGVLAVTVLRRVMNLAVNVASYTFRLSAGSSNPYVLWLRIENWVSIIATFLSVAALCLVAAGLTRRMGVSKSLWAVPALTAALAVLPLLVAILWELVWRVDDIVTAEKAELWLLTAIPAVITLTRSLIGILALTRTPAKAVSPPTASTEGEETAKPRVEDYLFRL